MIRKKPRYGLFVFIVVFCIFLYAIKNMGIMLNVTPSIPIGIYKTHPPTAMQRGDIVALCLSDPDKEYGLTRHYIQMGTKCHDSDPLIKKIIAVPGDTVRLQDGFMVVNHQELLFKTYYKDNAQRSLKVFPRGLYQQTSGYWMIGDHSPYSWDSRYWGPIARNQILYKLSPLIVF